jgi:U3 small nucleolar RNA-associated protein 5
VSSIDHDNSNFIYTSGLDAKVIKWNIKSCQQESAFDCGPEKPTAICIAGENIVTASKSIKVWNSESRLVQTFIGHSSNVLILKSFDYEDETFILSASKNDRNLSLWKVTEDEKKTAAAATFTLLNNSPNCVDYRVNDDHLEIACICRNDSMAYFDTSLSNLKSKKPIKGKFTLEIASDDACKVNHIPITAVAISAEELLIGYGGMLMKFELVSNQQEQKNTILVRRDPVKMEVVKKKKEAGDSNNVVTPITDNKVEILNVVSATRKAQKPVELPLETRLDNLTVGESKRPNAKKMTHQLVQGLHGNDAIILRNVLRQTDEETVRLTVKYLPSQYVMAFVNELSLLMTKKTAGSETALMWLRYLIQTHASSLMAYGFDNLNATFGTTLGIIDHRTQNLSGLTRLRGRLDLLVQQVKQNSDIDDEIRNENVLVYEDSGELN